MKQNCWQIKSSGREPEGIKAEEGNNFTILPPGQTYTGNE